VALTAHTLPEDIQQFRDAGFSDVLIKPLSRGQVADVLAGSFEGGPSTSGDGADDEIVEVLGGDTATLVRAKAITEIFASLEETEQRLRADAEISDLLEEVHKMTGLSAVVGLSETHARLISLNEALKNPDGRDLCELVTSIRKSLEAVRDAA
jgi:CheY-like chemotaxis protein